jgi:hypothetical protein
VRNCASTSFLCSAASPRPSSSASNSLTKARVLDHVLTDPARMEFAREVLVEEILSLAEDAAIAVLQGLQEQRRRARGTAKTVTSPSVARPPRRSRSSATPEHEADRSDGDIQFPVSRERHLRPNMSAQRWVKRRRPDLHERLPPSPASKGEHASAPTPSTGASLGFGCCYLRYASSRMAPWKTPTTWTSSPGRTR